MAVQGDHPHPQVDVQALCNLLEGFPFAEVILHRLSHNLLKVLVVGQDSLAISYYVVVSQRSAGELDYMTQKCWHAGPSLTT